MKTEFEWELDSPEYQKFCEFIDKLKEIEDEKLKSEIIFLVQDLCLILENKTERK